YQQTLTLRYFGGLLPAEIAANTATPIATVKSRLQRGLAMLRKDLAAQRPQSWRATLAVAVGIALPRRSLPAGTLLLMANSTKILIGSTLLAAATWMFLSMSTATTPPATSGASGAAAMANATSVDVGAPN